MVVLTFNTRIWQEEAGEFKAILVYKASVPTQSVLHKLLSGKKNKKQFVLLYSDHYRYAAVA